MGEAVFVYMILNMVFDEDDAYYCCDSSEIKILKQFNKKENFSKY